MKRMVIILLGFALIGFGIMLLVKDVYGQNIAGTAQDIAVKHVSAKINASLRSGIYNAELDGPLLTVERDSEGNIKYIAPDSRLINKLVLEFMTGVEEDYSLEDTQTVKVNLGVVTGSKILSQLPFTTTIRVQPLSMTKFQYETEFETQGINQTRYCVYVTIQSTIRILAPFTDETAEINRRLLIAEAIVVGKVPDSYVQVPKEEILDAVN